MWRFSFFFLQNIWAIVFQLGFTESISRSVSCFYHWLSVCWSLDISSSCQIVTVQFPQKVCRETSSKIRDTFSSQKVFQWQLISFPFNVHISSWLQFFFMVQIQFLDQTFWTSKVEWVWQNQKGQAQTVIFHRWIKSLAAEGSKQIFENMVINRMFTTN